MVATKIRCFGFEVRTTIMHAPPIKKDDEKCIDPDGWGYIESKLAASQSTRWTLNRVLEIDSILYLVSIAKRCRIIDSQGKYFGGAFMVWLNKREIQISWTESYIDDAMDFGVWKAASMTINKA